MIEKIYCKDCKWYEQGRALCHRVAPCVLPSLTDSCTYFSVLPCTAPDEYCRMAESREKADPEFIVAGKIEAGDAVCICRYGELEELKAENNRLRKLITEIREFFDWRGHYRGTTPLKSEYLMEIYTIANEEYEKRKAGK